MNKYRIVKELLGNGLTLREIRRRAGVKMAFVKLVLEKERNNAARK